MPDQIGNPRKTHPIPMRLRSALQDKDIGGSSGFRGSGYAKARRRALYRAGYRSTITGASLKDDVLECDHIIPYRLGGLTNHTNEQTNLRITDRRTNRFVDYAEGYQEKKPLRRLPRF